MPRRSTALHAAEYAAQCGATVVRVAQLEQLGLHRATIAHRCRPNGPWRSLVSGIVLLHNAAPTRDDRRRAALLHAGPDSVITGLDALALHGMQRVPQPSGPVHVLVPEDRRRASHGLVLVERTSRLPSPAPGRWPTAPLVRAVLDYTRRTSDRNLVRSINAEAVQGRMCTPAALGAELALGSGRGSALPRDVLREVSGGIRSVAEAKAHDLIRRSRLPHAMWNPRLVDAFTGRFIAVPAVWFDEVGLAWEIDSYEWHLSLETTGP
jgi:hypothetical protein